jgi:phosphomannomutase
MRRHDAVFGGEGNGGPIDPRVGYVRDSFVGIALILNAMASRQLTLSQLVSEMPQYDIRKHAISFDPAKLPSAVTLLKRAFDNAQLHDSAGYRFEWKNKWLLMRSSNTEPIVRVVAEAESAAEAEAICRQAIEVLEQLQA